MNSSRPYLIRALYEWIVENDCTPHLLVDADYPGTRVPPGYAKDGQVVLNVSPSAVRHLHMDNEAVSFEGRFAEQILPDQLHILNVSFLVPGLRREFGGCAGNIAYSLRLLGGEPVPIAMLGSDGAGYL